MTDYSNIDAKLEEYSEVFDIYLDGGKLPPTDGQDPLRDYIVSVIDNNPQLDVSDSTWTEVLKESLMSYFSQLLVAFAEIQAEMERELTIIALFSQANIDGKRKMWKQVRNHIRKRYSKFQVDLDGFTGQFGSGEGNNESVLKAITEDWEKACERSAEERQQELLNKSQKQWELQIKSYGSRDYEERRRIENIVYRSKSLREIVELIGREKESAKEEDNIIYKYLPKGARTGLPSEETDRVETGDDLHRTLTVEFAMPDELFYKRFATKELQQLAPLRQRKPMKTEEHRPKPRPKKGPIIVGIDTSGSMFGRPEQIAKALVIQLVRLARKDSRSCFLIEFSIKTKTCDLGKSGNILKLKDFLDNHFTGGTDPTQMMNDAIHTLSERDYEMADVLIISDFYCAEPSPELINKINMEKAKGTRFYGLQIGSSSTVYNSTLDRKWYE